MKKMLLLCVASLFIAMTATTLFGSWGMMSAITSGGALSAHGGWPGSRKKAQTGKFTGLTVPGCWSTRATATRRSR